MRLLGRRGGIQVDSVTATGTVIYTVPGGTVRDDGERLTVATTAPSGAVALLEVARAVYGRRLGVHGDHAFRKRLVRAAALNDIDIEFADPSLEEERQRLREQQVHNGRDPQ